MSVELYEVERQMYTFVELWNTFVELWKENF